MRCSDRSKTKRFNSRGQKNLGSMYESGRGVPEDWVEAAKWYRKSAEQGDSDGQAALARAYEFGIGVPQSRRDAIHWDRLAAAQGDSESAYYARWLSPASSGSGCPGDLRFRLTQDFVRAVAKQPRP